MLINDLNLLACIIDLHVIVNVYSYWLVTVCH